MMNYGPLIKYGLVFVVVIALCVGLVLYGEHRKQIEWDASLTAQARLSASEVIAQAVNTAHVETQYLARAGQTSVRTKIVKQEVVRYVESPSKKCILDRSFEWTWDRISGVLDASGEPLPTADASTGSADVSAGPTLTCAEVLLAYEDAIGQWRIERDRNQALSAWAQSAYDLATHE